MGVCALLLAAILPAEADTTPAASTHTSGRYMELADSAYTLMDHRQWDKAADCLQEALRSSPGNPLNAMLLSNLGIARTNKGDIAGALEAYDIALAINSKEPKIHDNMAFTLLKAERAAEALESLDRSLEIDSTGEWALEMRGYLLLGSGEIARAEKDFATLSRHHDTNADACIGMARCAEITGNLERAVECYTRAIDLRPEESLYVDRALARIQLGQIDEAEHETASALAIYPDCGDLYLIKGYIARLTYQTRASDVARKTGLRLGADKELDRRLFGTER